MENKVLTLDQMSQVEGGGRYNVWNILLYAIDVFSRHDFVNVTFYNDGFGNGYFYHGGGELDNRKIRSNGPRRNPYSYY